MTPRALGAALAALAALAGGLAPGVVGQVGVGPTLTSEEAAWLAAHGPLTLAWSAGFPPFSLEGDAGILRGINRDLLRLASVRVGFEFLPVKYETFAGTLEAVATGEADVAGTVARSPDREATLAFTPPYAVTQARFWTLESTTLPDNLAGAKVGAVNRSLSGAVAAERWPLSRVVPFESVALGMEAVRRGEVDAFVTNDATVSFLILQNGWFEIQAQGPVIEERRLSFAVARNETILLGILEKGLASVSREERAAIFVKWTGRDLNEPLPLSTGVSPRVLGFVAVGVVAAVAVVAIPAWIVTLRRRVAQKTREIAALAASLDARVQERTRELEGANRELAEFAHSVSHDLRAPLRAIDGFSRSVMEEHGTSLPPEATEDLARVRAGAQRMAHLIDELIDLGRVTRAPLKIADVDVTARALAIAQELRAGAPERRVDVSVEPGLRAAADPTLLDAVLTNLLDNAWKFTARHDSARVEVGKVSTAEGDAIFVRDDGAGFDRRFADKLFKPFERLHKPTEFPGTGVGLATASRIVQRHGGRMWAEGEIERGATFYFTIPRKLVP